MVDILKHKLQFIVEPAYDQSGISKRGPKQFVYLGKPCLHL